jgi:hypothetical protein
MPRGRKELAEQIIPKLREVEREVERGKTVAEAVKKIGVTEQTYSLGRGSSVGFGSTRLSISRISTSMKPYRAPPRFRWI